MQDLIGFIQRRNITNVVYFTSDVHYTAAVAYDPSRAQGGFTNFNPFYEFVIGPIHAGAFGPNTLDSSFGPTYEYGTCHSVFDHIALTSIDIAPLLRALNAYSLVSFDS